MIDRSAALVTVFGGAGFIGRYVCEALMKSGARVRIAQRNPRQAYIIQPLGQVGQLGVVGADITNRASVALALEGADAAINLCGVFGRRMHGVHVEGAANIAAAAGDAGANALVHISAIGASVDSDSDYGRTKGQGEAAVRTAFPNATIIRPSLVFGPEDNLTNRFAGMASLPFLPVLAARRNFQPVYVRDLASAIAAAALDPMTFGGKTFEIGGPQVMSMVELQREIMGLSGQDADVVELPDLVGQVLSSSVGWLPGAPLTRDQWRMLQHDNVAAKGSQGLEAFGIAPTPLAAVGREWLGRYRSGGKFAGRRVDIGATS